MEPYPEAQAKDNDILFEVTVKTVVGQVRHDPYGRLTPRAAAFQLIGEFGLDGEFQFPNQDGAVVTVNVVTEDPAAEAGRG